MKKPYLPSLKKQLWQASIEKVRAANVCATTDDLVLYARTHRRLCVLNAEIANLKEKLRG